MERGTRVGRVIDAGIVMTEPKIRRRIARSATTVLSTNHRWSTLAASDLAAIRVRLATAAARHSWNKVLVCPM